MTTAEQTVDHVISNDHTVMIALHTDVCRLAHDTFAHQLTTIPDEPCRTINGAAERPICDEGAAKGSARASEKAAILDSL